MQAYKKKFGEEKMKANEMWVNLGSSLFAGCLAAAVTNPLECITVNKQIQTDFILKDFIRQQGLWNICMKGIVPRVVYNGSQSMLFFTLVLQLGKIYDVELGDD